MAVKKIAVLGGGMGSLTSVIQLTSDSDWKNKYDITVYQMGWRLGGKGASGRNLTAGSRIEEHGLHLWFGFYDNAFNVIQQVYKENNRQPGMPLATWEEAFTGYNSIVLEENINGQWLHWPVTVPPNNLVPGTGALPPTAEEYIMKLTDWLCGHYENFENKTFAATGVDSFGNNTLKVSGFTNQASVKLGKTSISSYEGKLLLYAASKAAEKKSHSLLKSILDDFLSWLGGFEDDFLDKDASLRHFFILADLIAVTIIGMIEDGLLDKGFDVINNYDYREWLQKHGAAKITLNSAIVQAVYGLVFGGDRQYTFEAGTALRGLLRLGLTFKGHVYYRMMAGMGDAIFAPIYQVLQARGVKFQFFNKVTNLGLDEENNIGTLSIDVQATLAEDVKEYDPLVTVNDLPCWPNFPNVQYLAQGEKIQAENADLESYYSTWSSGVPPKTLQKGVDFDIILLGISIGALPTIASELITKSAAWQNMVKNVVPVSTIAYQLWLNCNINQMQWPYINLGYALSGSYQEPYDTWADMSDLVIRENWPAGYTPQNIAYFCGPTPQPYADKILQNSMQSNFTDASFPQTQTIMAKQYALQYLQTLSKHMWPGIWQGKSSFDFSRLVDIDNGTGQTRFNAQFFRANIDPTELYVMSFTGSSIYRLAADQTDTFGNLYITGDWIDNGFNAGCIEATVMAGLQTARAISGENITISGEKDL